MKVGIGVGVGRTKDGLGLGPLGEGVDVGVSAAGTGLVPAELAGPVELGRHPATIAASARRTVGPARRSIIAGRLTGGLPGQVTPAGIVDGDRPPASGRR
jgi:hypothetical protein